MTVWYTVYGLKQAVALKSLLHKKKFKNSLVDRSIYILDRGDNFKNIYVILYLDDLVNVTGNIKNEEYFKLYLMNKFLMVEKDIKLF